MVTIVSSLTGQALSTMDADDDVITLYSEAVRVALVSLQESDLSDHTVIRSQSNSARIPVGHLLGIGVFRSNQVTADAKYSDSTEKEEK